MEALHLKVLQHIMETMHDEVLEMGEISPARGEGLIRAVNEWRTGYTVYSAPAGFTAPKVGEILPAGEVVKPKRKRK